MPPRQICTHYPPATFPLLVLLRLFLVRRVKREKIDGEQLEVDLRQKEKSDYGWSLPSSWSLFNADKGPFKMCLSGLDCTWIVVQRTHLGWIYTTFLDA